jgi:predicted ATP-dependent serine protease
MAKKIGLKQLAQKTYTLVDGLSDELKRSIGEIEDCFDCIIYADSGNGKTNMTIRLLKELIVAMNCRTEYISYEEGHAKSMRDAFIERHDMYEAVGNRLELCDGYTFDELYKAMSRRKSAKIWVIDSIQYTGFTRDQVKKIKDDFVKSRKRKIVIYISHVNGKVPDGVVAKKIEYDAMIKIPIKDYVAFPKSRYGGNKPFIIWEQGAIDKWGAVKVNKFKGNKRSAPKRPKAVA